MDDLLGMCCTSAVPRFGEALPHSAASHVAREKVPTYIASSANTAGKAGICCFSLRAGPHFSAPLIPGGPARLSDRWWQVCNNTFCQCCSTCPRLEPCPHRPCLPSPRFGTKVQLGIMGWGAQIALSIVFPWAKPTPAPGDGWE